MKRIIIVLMIIVSPVSGMAKEEGVLLLYNNLKMVRLASLVKNRIYELKAELNSSDDTGNLQIMHLEKFESEKNQTKSGLFLECIKNVPCAIHLPFGRWQFARPYQDRGNHVEKLMQILIQEFELEFEKKDTLQRTYSNGTRIVGDPICTWRIGKAGQILLEKAAYKGETEYMDAKHAKAAWKALFTQ